MSRPERTSSAEAFYSRGEAQRYDDSARMSATQRALADRALQLLDLPVLLHLSVAVGLGASLGLSQQLFRYLGITAVAPILHF